LILHDLQLINFPQSNFQGSSFPISILYPSLPTTNYETNVPVVFEGVLQDRNSLSNFSNQPLKIHWNLSLCITTTKTLH